MEINEVEPRNFVPRKLDDFIPPCQSGEMQLSHPFLL